MRPLPYMFPYAVVFWPAFVWAFWPEFGIIRRARQPARQASSVDRGSLRVILFGIWAAMAAAVPLSFVPRLRFPGLAAQAAFFAGTATLIAGSLLRRHCWRMLGPSFTGDVRAKPDQPIITKGAYAVLRHPSYTAGILMNTGIGLALGSWASTMLLAGVTVAAYSYRIAVEERALLAAIGEPYRQFMQGRKRLIPYLY